MKKSKWLILSLVFVMVLSLALAGCTKTEEPAKQEEQNEQEQEQVQEEEKGGLADEQVLRLNWGAEPPDLDPQTTTDQVSFIVANAIYDGLVRLQADGSVQKGSALAEEWEISEDGLVYTFHLRDANWSDGTKITAEDFAFAWERVLNPATAAEYAYQLYHIKNAEQYNAGEITDASELGIKVINEKTLEVTLERPAGFFASLTSFITYLPAQKAAVEKFGDEFATAADKMVVSGPFMISEWTHEQKLVLVKNPKYWDADSVVIERIEGDMITDNNTKINLYETDGLDLTGVPSEFLEKYQDTEEFKSMAQATTWYLQFNTEDKYFANLNIRKAFAYAADAKSYVDNVLADGSLTAEGLTPPLLPGKGGKEFAENRGVTMPKFDKDKAQEYLAKGLEELGVTKEQFQEEVSLVTGEGTWWSRTGQAFQQMWKQNLGVELNIEAMSFAMRLDRYNKKDYQISIAGWGGDYNDPMTFMDMFVTNGGNNDAFFSSERYDELIKIANTTTGDGRVDAMLEAEEILGTELPIFPLFHPSRNFVQRTYVQGVARFPVGVDSEYKWVTILKH